MGRKAKKSGAKANGTAGDAKPEVPSDQEQAEDKEGSQVKAPAEPKVPLLDDDGGASRKFKQCLVAIFGRFDADGDKLLSEGELRAFSRAANADDREFTDDELAEIQEFFDWKETGPNGCGGLTLRGWLQMYETQTGGAEEETWSDLHNLGYNDQLELQRPVAKKGQNLLQPKSTALREALTRFVELGEAGSKVDGDLLAFVSAFVASDVPKEDQVDFVESLKADGGTQLTNLLAELRCCATGENVFRIEQDDPERGPVTIHFHSPTAGLERVDRAVTFVRDGDEWRAEG